MGSPHSPESIQTISEIGLSLLLFMIGLEIDLKKMLSAGRVITLTAGAQILGCVAARLAGVRLGRARRKTIWRRFTSRWRRR